MRRSELAQYIDHTLLKPEATEKDIRDLCTNAVANNVYSVCVNPDYVPLAYSILRDSSCKVCTVVGFPLGASVTKIKEEETRLAIGDGATEIDMVLNIGAMKSRDYSKVSADIQAVSTVCRDAGVLLKVILETCLLTSEEIVTACNLAVESGADFVKTSTGFSTDGATVENVRLMKNTVKDRAKVKASGGIRDLKTFKAMIEAGASRIGTSSTVKILGQVQE